LIVKVRKLIDKLESERASRLGIKLDRILEEISRLAFSNVADFYRIDEDRMFRLDLSKVTRDLSACLQEIKVDTTGGFGDGERKVVLRTTVKLADKLKALDMLMRHLGAYNDKVRLEGLESLPDMLAKSWGNPVPTETKQIRDRCRSPRIRHHKVGRYGRIALARSISKNSKPTATSYGPKHCNGRVLQLLWSEGSCLDGVAQ
jgi:hypothetical protein